MKVLIIDDNERLSQIYQSIISQEGHQTEIEVDSNNAIDRIQEIKPDLVLLDIMMEPLSGWDVLELIRSNEVFFDLPVIILTGKMMTMQEAFKYGMQIEGFIMKPLERSMIISSIQEVWEILTECEARYVRAIKAGLSEEKAAGCRRMIRKRKILAYLKDLLARQEQIVNLRPDEASEMRDTIDQLKRMIEGEYMEFARGELTCP
ncbi:MAG TPA: response regulator [Methanospirillum sp.]|nr:response regulator [Methanospirillum sp.]